MCTKDSNLANHINVKKYHRRAIFRLAASRTTVVSIKHIRIVFLNLRRRHTNRTFIHRTIQFHYHPVRLETNRLQLLLTFFSFLPTDRFYPEANRKKTARGVNYFPSRPKINITGSTAGGMFVFCKRG
jgi:hypothetical protein